MSVFKLHTLKQRLWAIVVTSFVARVIMFFALPNSASSLAPDEGTYAFLTKWIGESKPASEFPAYGQGLYLSGRTMIFPASLLYRVGFNELDAVRLVASAYGFCMLAICVFVILKMYRQFLARNKFKTGNENLITAIILAFAFLPSHFVWSNLGLRESTTEFWLITAFMTFFIVFHQEKITILSLLILMGSIAFTFSSRPQVGWVLGVALVVFLVINLREARSYFVLPVVLCAVVLGSLLSAGSSLGASSPTSASTSIVEQIFNPLLMAGEIVENKQEANQVGAASVIQVQSCPSKFGTYFCIAWRAPYMVSTFLFRPIIGVDVTSTSSLIAALENFFWFALFMTIFVLSIRKRAISFAKPLLPSFIFLILYVLGASAYQGNMGTGFRHKSLILWAVLLVIFALAWRKPVEPVEITRDNSQESAV